MEGADSSREGLEPGGGGGGRGEQDRNCSVQLEQVWSSQAVKVNREYRYCELNSIDGVTYHSILPKQNVGQLWLFKAAG